MALAGGALLALALRGRVPFAGVPWRRRAVVYAVVLVTATAGSVGAAAWLFEQWDGSDPVEDALPMPGVPGLSFSSPQAREIAAQVRPFVEKNTRRIEARSEAYLSTVEASLMDALPDGVEALQPRPGERIVLAEADTQGSFVGQRVRALLYDTLLDRLGEDAVAVRTISGDVTSNGTFDASVDPAGSLMKPSSSTGTPLIDICPSALQHTT